MVTCNIDGKSKMNHRNRRATNTTTSLSSGFRLLDGDQCDTVSSTSRNSIYKQKIDSMFDDSRSISSIQRLEIRSSARDRRSNRTGSTRLQSQRAGPKLPSPIQEYQNNDVRRASNSVQAQIERIFTDVAEDAVSCSFTVRCLGALPLREKVTSLYGLQEPLRQLYLSGAGHGNQNSGNLDICATGLRIRLSNDDDPQLTPFHNIAVWSAVKFVVSPTDGGAAFLPLITDPENIDKSTLFSPLSAADKRRLSSSLHSPIFAVVMRSQTVPKQIDCHAFVCQTPEDAIVMAATLYQSLMAQMSNDTDPSPRIRKARNQNGVSCISIASSTVSKAYLRPISTVPSVQRHNPNQIQVVAQINVPPSTVRGSHRCKGKRNASSSLSGESDIIREANIETTTTEERKKKSHKTKRAPPIPTAQKKDETPTDMYNASMSYLEEQRNPSKNPIDQSFQGNDPTNGDILTRVAIPRSGSFLNTAGLARYKSRATRRAPGKNCGGGGSPLGFSELFNEFRLQENLHSLDDILNAIIDSDGMSFNDLKPIYKEFLLKLAVTLTKDELYQRSKSIMRRQKKKKLRKKNTTLQSFQNKRKKYMIGAKGLTKMFWLKRFKSKKSKQSSDTSSHSVIMTKPTREQKPAAVRSSKEDRLRNGTSGSDVSDVRNEHTLRGQHRNSSSGYVSCSECSYDSESCTCTSADRCYCSFGSEHDQLTAKLRTCQDKGTAANRTSMVSCRTDDKCYCSMVDGSDSVTTWCDTDSCISTSKCYCERSVGKCSAKIIANQKREKKPSTDKFALDYELFNVDNRLSKHVDSQDAISVKKSVEMAALFSNVKLNQTTDITRLEKRSKRPDKIISTPPNKKGTIRSDVKPKIVKCTKKCHKSIEDDVYNSIGIRPVSSLEDSLGYLP